MTNRNLYELGQVAAILAITLVFFRMTRRGRLGTGRGVHLTQAGFLLLLFGSVLDFSDGFSELASTVVFGPTPVEAFLETFIGYIAGPALVALGLSSWLPHLVEERRAAEKALREHRLSEERLDRFFDLSHDLIAIADTQGRMLRAGPAFERNLGYRLEDLTGRPLTSLVAGGQEEGLRRALERLRQGKELLNVPVRVLARDGSTRLVRLNARAEARTGLVYGVGHDLTEAEAANLEIEAARAAAEAANRAKSGFLARMSHELRTPLNSVIGFSSLLLKNRSGALGEAELDYAQRIRSNGLHLLSLVNDVLDLSRIEAGRLDLRIERFDLRELVESVLAELAPTAAARGLRLRADLPEGQLPVTADALRLRQILTNLAGNALKFTARGAVTLKVKCGEISGAPVSIEVRDTGPGIAADHLPRLFEPYFQAPSATTGRERGSGLGLAIARPLAEAMGFALTVESAVGSGSTFRLELSDEDETDSDSRELDARWLADVVANVRRLEGRRAILFAPGGDSRLLLGDLVSEISPDVVVPATREEALAALRETPDALVVADADAFDERALAAFVEGIALFAARGARLLLVGSRASERKGLPEGVAAADKPLTRDRLTELLDRLLGAEADPR